MDKNSIFELKEKSHSKKTELLIKKRMFDWATELATRELPNESVQQRELLQHIYKLHGDALYEKKLYDNALSIYMKSIDLNLPLETSYVIEKYLDANKISHIGRYLRRLHEKNMAEKAHTELLFKCYIKEKENAEKVHTKRLRLLNYTLSVRRFKKKKRIVILFQFIGAYLLRTCRLQSDMEYSVYFYNYLLSQRSGGQLRTAIQKWLVVLAATGNSARGTRGI